jgi:hypothetical protein
MWQEGDALIIRVSANAKQYIWENGRPDIFRGFIRKRGESGLSRGSPLSGII